MVSHFSTDLQSAVTNQEIQKRPNKGNEEEYS